MSQTTCRIQFRVSRFLGAAFLGALLAASTPILAETSTSGPFAVWAHEGVLIAGPDLTLRPQVELAELWRKRWVPPYGSITSDVRGFPVLRPDATAAEIEVARKFARDELLAPEAFMGTVGAGVEYGAFTDEQRAGFSHAWNVTRPALDILAVTGTTQDAQYLARLVAGLQDSQMLGALAAEMAMTSVHISLRLGDVAGSPAAKTWHAMEGRPRGLAWSWLGIALGRVGYQPAIQALIQQLAVDRIPLDTPPYVEGSAAFEVITMVEDPAVLALAVDLATGFDNFTRADLLGGDGERYLAGVNVPAVFDTALGYAAAFLPEAERGKLAVGVPASARANGAYFETPADLAALVFGMLSGDVVGATNAEMMPLPCWIYGDLEGARRDAAEQGYLQVVRDLGTHFDVSNPEADARTFNGAGKWRCIVNSAALRLLKNPEDSAPGFFPAWTQYAFRAPSDFLPDFAAQPDAPVSLTGVLEEYEDAEIEALINDPSFADRHGIMAYQYYRSVVDPSGLGTAREFIGTSDERFFLESLEVPTVNPLYVAAKVSLSPREAGDRMLFGITMDLAAGDLGGLAGMINSSAETMDTFTADFGRPLIDKVVLRSAHGASELAFIQTTQSGTHVFELLEAVSSNANLYIDIYFQGADRGWTQSFPLFASPFGYAQIRQFGRIGAL